MCLCTTRTHFSEHIFQVVALTVETKPEECDTRMLIYAAHNVRHGHTKVVLLTVDIGPVFSSCSDEALSSVWSLDLVAKRCCVISASDIASSLGYERHSIFLPCITGCQHLLVRGKAYMEYLECISEILLFQGS